MRSISVIYIAICAVAVVATASACSLEVSFDGTRYACDDGVTCPSGFECHELVCVQQGTTPPPDQPDADVRPDAPPGTTLHTWRDDAPADFDGTASAASVQPRGALEPAAYYTGGLLARGYDAYVIPSGADATWADLEAAAPTARTSIVRSARPLFGGEVPPGLGLSLGDDMTMAFEGEIFLDAGTWTFFVMADDHGFVDLAGPAGTFTRVADSEWPAEGSGTFSAPVAGWYGIRFATSDDSGGAGIVLHFQGPGVGPYSDIPRDRLRARTDGQIGLFQAAFDDERLLGDEHTTIDAFAPADVDWSGGRPADLGLTSSDRWSTRWTGQLRVEVEGDYAFRYETDDGQRLWIDGAKLLDAWDSSTHTSTTAPVHLTVGWHDVVIDVSDGIGAARALLTVASGPELVGEALPVTRLRPVEGRAERYETTVNRNDVTIIDTGSVETSVALAAPAGTTVTGVEVSYTFDHTYPDDLVMRLIAPNNATITLRNQDGGDVDVVGEVNRYVLHSLDGAPVAGTWKLRFSDVAQPDVGTIRDFQLTVHYAGGQAPIAPVAVYESQVRDLGAGVIELGTVSWSEARPAGTGVAVMVRSGATAEACAQAPWSAPLADPAGTPAGVAAQRFLQYRVEMTSEGDAAAAVESVVIDYLTSP